MSDISSRSGAASTIATHDTHGHSYVDWGAILAGGVIAAAVSTLMTAFGAAIGLTASSPYEGSGISAKALGIASALWILWVAISSFMIGGYVAGRLRRRVHDTSEHESDVRDGSHGLVVWALGTLMIAYLATSTVANVAKAGAEVVSGGASALTSAAGKAAGQTDVVGYSIDRLTRAAPKPGGDAARIKEDVTRIIGNSISTGTLSADDRTYLTNEVAAAAGIPPEEATKRVNETLAQMQALKEKAKQAAETARKTGILVAFLTAASLAIAAAASWWAATMGGKHHDQGSDFSHFTTWR